MLIDPVTLEGSYVRLEPLSLSHLQDLCEVGLDDELWRLTMTQIGSEDDMRRYIETALDWQRAGTALPFATVLRASGRAVGSTRFANIDRSNCRTEIGWTWVGCPYQRTAINTEAKLLMLEHAFERMHCIRVEFKTDSLNERSRQAILRLGAQKEGLLRNHMITPTGRVRHSVYYSIVESEWPAVRAMLRERLARG